MLKIKSEEQANWAYCSNSKELEVIHQKELNIAIQERDISYMYDEIQNLIDENIEFRVSGDVKTILNSLLETINPVKYTELVKDISKLLLFFKEITKSNSFKIFIASVNNNMCRRFHYDINDLRMLCTYSGPGTLWLANENVNWKELTSSGNNDSIVIDKSKIKQASAGDLVILKGAIYGKEGTRAIVHRSPTIEESGLKRLLLRIDTNAFLVS